MTQNDTQTDDMHRCPECNEPMHPDEEWKLRQSLAAGLPSEGSGEYVHERCYPATGGERDVE